MPRRSRSLAAAAGLLFAVVAAGCSTSEPTSTGKPVIVTSVYALQFAADAVVGGDVGGSGDGSADVVNLTPAGVEPHDLELSVQQVRQMRDAELIVYVGGIAKAVDDAVAEAAVPNIEAVEAIGTDAITGDPHFWLNPLLMAKVADAIAVRMAEIDPANQQSYEVNANLFRSQMEALDRYWLNRTRTCETREFVSSHSSFAYLAKRYNLTAHAVLGLNPDAEPTPAALNEVIAIIREKKLTTMYAEAVLNTKVANTIARETGAKVRILDPMEGNTGNRGYEAIMRSNAAAFAAGNGCTS